MKPSIFFFFLCLIFPMVACADDNRPLTIFVQTQGETNISVSWKIPPNLDKKVLPTLSFTKNCNMLPPLRKWSDTLGHWSSGNWECKSNDTTKSFSILYPGDNPNLYTIVRFSNEQETYSSLILPAHASSVEIPNVAERKTMFSDFLLLGIEHILEGYDHLLFVFCLVLIAGNFSKILTTLTGFTIGHSITLALSTLGILKLPIRAIECSIALSIVFLAVEIIKANKNTLTWRRPITVSATFGLLHGFGFAAVLEEIGLPSSNTLSALLAFNLGIEIGQALFACLVFSILFLLSKIPSQKTNSLNPSNMVASTIGVVASFWLFERILSG